jgi:hypothetical protein
VEIFSQSISLRVHEDGRVVGADGGGPLPSSSYTTPGHGDFFRALNDTGALERLRARGVRFLFVCNVDNLGATVSPALFALAARLHEREHVDFMAEVVERRPEDGAKVGAVVRTGDMVRILEGFRTPEGMTGLREVSINSFTFAVDALAADVPLEVHAVKKEVAGEKVIQGETILCEATGALRPDGQRRFHFAAVRVPREAPPGHFFEGRFAPVKTPEDLEALRREVSASLAQLLPMRSRRRHRAIDTTLRGFPDGGVGPTTTVWSPGRINIIGEHTDYSEGFCLPAAVDHGLWAAARRREDRRVLVRSSLYPDVVELPLDMAPATGAPRWARGLVELVPILKRHGVDVPGC